MASTQPKVRRARATDHSEAKEILAQAFANDPVMSWLMGPNRNAGDRLSHLFGHMLDVELANDDHFVDIIDSGQAVAFWHDVDHWKASPGQVVKMLPAAWRTFGRRLPQALRTLSMMEKVHPAEPHRHLAFIGVHPSCQGQGLGGALLADMTQDCDTRGLGAYLENSNPKNEALYARYGFESRGPVALPSGAPVATAMWRRPR
ncbi:GNAT family N-acetyltransferase [uncultured Ilumatobacter sp.]|jgi:ribosomal protein S18 acetylase RimI-like enzyme|uniref:GNAT family N-acetyltransferase n=1 Tax=Ilumatobacter sp. TaxID=1967498 RepID=UPI00309C1F27|tara:strand:- start:3 stop:611 length:609 start_codon:yes stop_codon:yes gene_type:complete